MFEVLGAEKNTVFPDISTVQGLIHAIVRDVPQKYPAVGLGRELSFEDEGISGYALICEAVVLHSLVFAE